MSDHTPGPWTCQPIGDETDANILGSRRELIATVADYDANLIAAAPDMHHALQLAQVYIRNIPGGAGKRSDTLRIITAAINKAKGI